MKLSIRYSQMSQVLDFLRNLQPELQEMVQEYGGWIFLVVSAVIFCETGLIVLGILPGDSLLFAAGSIAAAGVLDPVLTMTVFPAAAFLGDQANYGLGKLLGRYLFRHPERFLFNKQTPEKAERFYKRYGARAVIFGRFIPVIRSIVPFAAATGRMAYRKFIGYSIAGAAAWSYTFLLLGYFFGQIQFIQENLWLVIAGVVIISFVPTLFGAKAMKKA